MGRIFTREFRNGAPIQASGFTLVPFSQVVRFQIPGFSRGLIWNRPSSILVSATDGQEFPIPIKDVTRQVQIGLFCGAFLVSFLYFMAIRLRRRA